MPSVRSQGRAIAAACLGPDAAVLHQELTGDGIRRTAAMLRTALEVWLVVQFVKPFAAAMGPGTTAADLHWHGSAAVEIANRLCLDWGAMPRGFLDIARVHWPLLFSTQVEALQSFSIDSNATQGMWGIGWLLGGAMLLALVRISTGLVRDRRWCHQYDFCVYLMIVGAMSITGYVVGRCGVIVPSRMRYDMLSIIGAVGLAAWYLRIETSNSLRTAWILAVVLWAGVGTVAHGRLWVEYVRHAPAKEYELIAKHMLARGIKYGVSDYATAYQVSFLTNEQILMIAANRPRIKLYLDEVRLHISEAVRVTDRPCEGGVQVIPGFYFCQP